MGRARTLLAAMTILWAGTPAYPAAPPPPVTGPADIAWPPPDPKSWWDDKRPSPPEASDPLGGRRAPRTDPAAQLDGDPLIYRLWDLPPLQIQSLKRDEVVLEVWVRPSLSVRQTVARVVVRSDGHAFVQARAGLACCTPAIGRRVGFDAELPSGSGRAFLDLAADPLWDSPRDVRVTEGGGAADTLCVDGASYDLYLLTAQRARHVRRACAPEEVGQAAPVLEAVLGAALGHEPRIDVLFPTGAKFDADKAAYREFVAQGGVLRPAPNARSTAVPEPSP